MPLPPSVTLTCRQLYNVSSCDNTISRRLDLPVVKLGLAVVGTVNSDVLRADEVLAVRGGSRDSKLEPVFVPAAPGGALDVLALVADALLVDLEPWAVTLVILNTAVGVAHVDKHGARMLHGSVNAEAHGYLGTGLDFKDLGAAGALESAQVAAEVWVVGGQVVKSVLPFGWHVCDGASVLADVLEGLANELSLDIRLVDEVMSRGNLRNSSGNEGGGELHFVLRAGFDVDVKMRR